MSGLIINPYILAAPAASITFDPTKKGASAALSGGNLTMTVSASSPNEALATSGYTTGKRYFEMYVSTAGVIRAVGISSAGGSTSYDTDLGQEAGEYAMRGDGNSYFAGSYGGTVGPTYTAGDVIGVAIDHSTRKVWWAKNNTWMAGNPAAGTGAMVTYATGLGTIFAAAQGFSGTVIVARFAAADQSYSPPSGFSAYG